MAYTGLRSHLTAAGLQEETSLWDQVNDFGWLRASKSPHWNVLPEAERVATACMTVEGQTDDDDYQDAGAQCAVATSARTSSVASDDGGDSASELQSTASAIVDATDAGGAAAVAAVAAVGATEEEEEDEPDEI